MRTIRNCVFETNSSSCHVITLMTPQEQKLVLEGKALIYAHSKHEDEANIAEVYDSIKFAKKMQEIFGDELTEYKDALEELWSNIRTDLKKHDMFKYSTFDEWAEKHGIEGTLYGKLEDFFCCCNHEEDNSYCVDNAKEIEIGGVKTLISSWESYC